MNLTRLLLSASKPKSTTSVLPPPSFREQANEWIASKWGRRFRIGLLGTTIVAYPMATLLVNGPLLKYVFPRKHSVTDELPADLQNLINMEFNRWKDREGRMNKDAVVYFALQNKEDQLDTVAAGSLGVRSGARIAFPFFAKFKTEEEALDYARKHLEPLNFMGESACVLWDSPLGKELLETFVLSDKAKQFLIQRDILSNDGYYAYATRAISWATWTTFTSIFTYWLHWGSRLCQGKALSFVVIYSIFVAVAWFANQEWHKLYRYITDIHADSVSAHVSFDHCAGGKEYYWKMLKRNRILRDLTDEGIYKVKATGDIRGLPTSIITRYELLKDVSAEDDEMAAVHEGDDF
ncbi:hypothetical protein L596_025016 [Steinernema carpocapsae]|uniref:Transmembrane protein 177 n=1 Tax=Steinernema carpocapsae TaxID=34508 RepID=A0A4U5M6J5_STECR|nr:hypothetical protein L596_025016 [Steinernema carpocapsae]